MGRGEGAHSDGEGAIDRVGTAVGTKSVTVFNGGRETRTDDGSTSTWIMGTPCEGVGEDTMLVGVG